MAEVRSIVPYWLWPGDGRPRRQVEDEIAEELRLHVDLMAEENERRGMTPDEARREAERRFGDVAAIERRCRTIKRGEIVMLQRVQAVLTTLLLIAVTFVAVRQWNTAGTTAEFMNQTTSMLHTIRRDMEQLTREPPEASKRRRLTKASATTSASRDITGRVVNEAGEPLAGVRVICGPSASSQQTLVTGPDGQFVFPDAIPDRGSTSTVLVAWKEGYAFEAIRGRASLMQANVFLAPLKLTMVKSTPITLQTVVDPRAEMPTTTFSLCVFEPVRRVIEKPGVPGEEKSVRYVSSPYLRVLSDRSGRLTLPWFAAGDVATFRVKGRMSDDVVGEYTVRVADDGSVSFIDPLPGGGGFFPRLTGVASTQ